MFQQPADVMPRGVTQQRVALLVIEDVLALLPETLVGVHARTIILKQRLWHHRDRLATATPDVLDDVFVQQNLVGHLRQRRILQFDSGLAGGAYLMVMNPNS